MTPYQVIGVPMRKAILLSMLVGVAQAPIAGVDSVVATYEVAPDVMLTLVPDQGMRMFLQGRYVQNRTASAAGAAITERVQVNGDGRRMLRTSRKGRSFPTGSHPDVIAYTRIGNNGPWVRARVMAADFGAGWVDVETPPNAAAIRVYYTFGDGEITLKVSRPSGSNTGAVQIYSNSARGLHETDQMDRDTAAFLVRSAQPVPAGFRLLITVRASTAVYFDGLAEHDLMLPGSETAIQILDPVALASMAEQQLRGG